MENRHLSYDAQNDCAMVAKAVKLIWWLTAAEKCSSFSCLLPLNDLEIFFSFLLSAKE